MGEIERHPRGLKCKDCVNYQQCSEQIYRNGELDFCSYEKSRFSTEEVIKKDDVLNRAIRRIQHERPAWGEDT